MTPEQKATAARLFGDPVLIVYDSYGWDLRTYRRVKPILGLLRYRDHRSNAKGWEFDRDTWQQVKRLECDADYQMRNAVSWT